jgi:hypothetical protein
MKIPIPTPVSIVESFFDIALEPGVIKFFDTVSDSKWIEFAKCYHRVMKEQFIKQYLTFFGRNERKIRLFFEPRMAHEWEKAIHTKYQNTPLLGSTYQPELNGKITPVSVSEMMNPLKKHLLLADSVYVCDNFYKCFDFIADWIDWDNWRDEVSRYSTVRTCIRNTKSWIPILIELKELIENNSLIFMPYYVTRSFPYGGNSPKLKFFKEKLRLKLDKSKKHRKESQGFDLDTDWTIPPKIDLANHQFNYFSEDEVIGAWLNANILKLDPVFPNRPMFEYASRLYFKGENESIQTSDLISLSILPFGDNKKKISIIDLVNMRKNEAVFNEVKNAVRSCREYLQNEVGDGTSKKAVTDIMKSFLNEKLLEYEKQRKISFKNWNDHKWPSYFYSIAFSTAIGLAVSNPVTGFLLGAILNPTTGEIMQSFDHKRKALSRLQTLL